jgi:hypothetical protein
MKLHHCLLLLLVLSTVAHARLGDTEAELFARFGQPKVTSKHSIAAQGKMWEMGPRFLFHQADWRIHCDFADGRCVRIEYDKTGDWTEDQIQLVLGSNSQGAKWTETTKGSIKVVRSWKRADGADATWNKFAGIKMIVPAYERAKQVIEAKAKAAASEKPKI